MKKYQLNGLDLQEFKANTWQNRPLFLPKAIIDFEPPIDADHLFALAADEDAESRFITSASQTDITVEEGPFEEDFLQNLPTSNCSLLIQKLDHWIEDIAELRHYFAFIPHWRFDDVMGTFARPEGTTGPHIDNYDVFLLQGSGKRTWKVENKIRPLKTLDDSHFVEDLDVKILNEFLDHTIHELNPGDLLYIPAGFAHWGTSHEDNLSFSFGFRSPSIKSMAYEQFLEQIDLICEDDFFQEKDLLNYKNPGEIPSDLASLIKSWPDFLPPLNDKSHEWFGKLVTFVPQEEMEKGTFTAEELLKNLDDMSFEKSPSAKFAYHKSATELRLFVNGVAYALHLDNSSAVEHLCNVPLIENQYFKQHIKEHDLTQVLTTLINLDVLFFE
jgi:50S ribosomal protein L16 3-hydroxylase